MKYGLTIADEDSDLAAAPGIGAETRVKYSPVLFKTVGKIRMSGVGAGTLKLARGYVGLGCVMQAVLLTANPGISAALGATFAVVYDDDAVGTATATFGVPDYAPDSGFHMPQCLAVDLLPGNNAKTIKSVTSLTSMTGGAPGVKLGIFELPPASSWEEFQAPVVKNVDFGSRGSVAIAVGYDPAAFVKAGRGTVPNVTLSSKHASFAMDVARVNGQKFAYMLESWSDDRVLRERVVVQSILAVSIPRPDGNGEVEATASGMGEHVAVFV